MDVRFRLAWPPLTAVIVAFFADPLDRDHALAFRGIEHDHALGRTPDNADAFDAGADELAAVGDEHELIPVLHRERSDQLAGLFPDRAIALADVHGDDAFAASAGDAIFVGRRALAVAAFGNREHELLRRGHRHVLLLTQLDCVVPSGFRTLLGVGRALFGVGAVEAAPYRAGVLEIGGALVGGRIGVPQDR